MTKSIISDLANSVQPSAIRKIFNESQGMSDVVNFGIGEPDFTTPQFIIDAAVKAMADGYTHYTVNAGLPELRRKISTKLKQENNIEASPEKEIIVTCGGMGGLYLALRTLINRGDEVLIPSPAWVNYEAQVILSGGTAVPVPVNSADGFALNAGLIENFLTSKTKVLLLNTPCNPTGKLIPEDELRRIAQLASDRGIFIIADEVYEKFVWNGFSHVSISSFPEAADRTVTVNSFSKSYAMTGWRIGFASGVENIISNMVKLQENIYACPSSISQKAAEAALDDSGKSLETMVQEYEFRRSVLLEGLGSINGINCIPTEGSFYTFADISSTGMSSEDFAVRLLREKGVAVIPGSAFGETGEGFVRLSFAAGRERLREGIVRIKSFVEKRG
jgi:aminotransferase